MTASVPDLVVAEELDVQRAERAGQAPYELTHQVLPVGQARRDPLAHLSPAHLESPPGITSSTLPLAST